MKNKIKTIGYIAIITVFIQIFIACGPPKLNGTVTIDGELMLGKTLTVNTSSLGGSGIITYQWTRNGSTFDNGNNTSYTLKDEDRNAVFTVTVIRSDNSGSVTSTPVTPTWYSIGDTGPGGGIIVYRNLDGFTMTDTGEKAYYLEAAPENYSQLVPWASSDFINIDVRGAEEKKGIGTGRANTAAILSVIGENGPAAKACDEYVSPNGTDDWFLPSLNELNEMRKANKHLGNLSGSFWSSTQSGRVGAYWWDFHRGNNGQVIGYKGVNQHNNHVFNVRAVRAF